MYWIRRIDRKMAYTCTIILQTIGNNPAVKIIQLCPPYKKERRRQRSTVFNRIGKTQGCFLLAMHDENTFRFLFKFAEPVDEPILVRMGGKPADGIDFRFYRYLFAKSLTSFAPSIIILPKVPGPGILRIWRCTPDAINCVLNDDESCPHYTFHSRRW